MGTKPSKKIAPKQKSRAPTWLWLLIAAGVALIAFVVIDSVSRNSSAPATGSQVTGAPRLSADKEKIDLGDVKLGQTVSVSFDLTNVGDQALQFTASPYIEVKEGCWPPTPTIGAMVLQPGEKTRVSMSFMMHGAMGGLHDFRLHLPTNDPNNPDKTLQVLSNWVE